MCAPVTFTVEPLALASKREVWRTAAIPAAIGRASEILEERSPGANARHTGTQMEWNNPEVITEETYYGTCSTVSSNVNFEMMFDYELNHLPVS